MIEHAPLQFIATGKRVYFFSDRVVLHLASAFHLRVFQRDLEFANLTAQKIVFLL